VSQPMRFAYADPPYLGCGRFYADRHPDALAWDRLETHAALIERLCAEFSDGWALSLHTPSLRHLLPLCPEDVRVMAWVKPFCSFKPGVNPAYAWEPVIVRGGRRRGRDVPTVRDWVSVPVTLQRGCPGAKPQEFALWLFEVLNLQPGDEFCDLFPGSGAVTQTWDAWARQGRLLDGVAP
jgi:hypothetical protein